MSLSIRAYPETLRTLAFGAIGAGYTALGTPFIHPIRLFLIQNTTDVLITVSFDGANDHMVIPSNSFILLDISSNRDSAAEEWYFAQGTQISIKGAPTSGSVYLSVFYGR